MKKLLALFCITTLMFSCKKGKQEILLRSSVGSTNTILAVMKTDLWDNKVGDEVRTVFGEHQLGLPQPETIFSMTQTAPEGFTNLVNNNRAIMILGTGKEESITVVKDKYARPQTIVNVFAKDEYDLINLLRNRGGEITKIFKDQDLKFTQSIFNKKKIKEDKFKTVKNLGVSLTIPSDYRLVEDSGEFLWLRHHLKSGIARGDGSNNILLYSVPLEDETKVAENITKVRDMMGKKYIPGKKEGMYMITEELYTPHTFEIDFNGKKAYETRGKWEVKNDAMAGPFLNYSIIDKVNNRVVVIEGFTYAPSVNKRDFVFELEAIAKSLKIK